MKKNLCKIPYILTLLVVVIFAFYACNKKVENSYESIIKGEIGNHIDEKLSAYIQNIISSHDLPGIAIGVVKENEIVYAKAFGYKNVETHEQLNIKSIFHLASVSKPFVATAIMQLVEQGKIDLDSSVIKYLPYFKLDGDEYKTITVKQMLSHISGMPDEDDYNWDKPVYSEDALERYVRSLSSEKIRNTPGEVFAYSNMAFDCLGDVISKVSGMSFADYTKKNILDPSGMKTSTFLKPKIIPQDWVSPHIRIFTIKAWDEYPYNRMHGPSSTLHSNVVEMCNWAITNMNRGIYKNQRILKETSYDVLWKPWFEIGNKNHMGLSWFLSEYRDEKTIGHGGSDTGFNTDFIIMPEKSIAVVVLSNISPAPVSNITDAAMDILLGFDFEKTLIPASVPVLKELETKGLEAAVELWNTLKENHPEKYNFNIGQIGRPFMMILEEDRIKEAIEITHLCVKIFPEEIKGIIKREAQEYKDSHPDNKAATEMLNVIKND